MIDNNSTSQSSTEEVAEVFRRLRELQEALRSTANSNDQAITLIKAIIAEGWDTGPRIVGTLKQLGFDAKHAGTTLGKGRGKNPKLCNWRRDEDGRYVVHEDAAAD